MSLRRTIILLGVLVCGPAESSGQFPVFRTAILAENPARRPTDLVTGDFDGDQQLDAATSNSSNSAVTVFLQLDGAIFADHDEAVANVPTALIEGDFTGDGKIDLVVAHGSEGAVTCLRGLGVCEFVPAPPRCFEPPGVPITVPGSPVGLAAGDFDRDGNLDLGVASEGPSESSPGALTVLLGTGDCTFETAATLTTDGGASAVATGDVDGDGVLDLLGLSASSASLSVFLGVDGRTFSSRPSVSTGPEPQALALGELNHDGSLDVVTADKNGDSVSVLFGNGAGGFALDRRYPVGTAPVDVALGDLNRDGHPDIAASNNLSGDVSVLLGDGSGRFGAARSFIAEGQPVALALARFDSDELLDVLSANVVGDSGSLAVLRNRGAGVLHGVEDVPVGGAPTSVTAADVDDDAFADLVVTDEGGQLLVLSGSADGHLKSAQIVFEGLLRDAAVADFNRDRRPDIVVVNGDESSVTVLLAATSGNFPSRRTFSTGSNPSAVSAGDFDADGRVDLAVPSFGPPAELSILIGRGDGSFAPPCATAVGEGPLDLAVDDFNADGFDDVVLVEEADQTVNVLLGNGDCTLRSAVRLGQMELIRGPTSVVSRYLDSDGIPDLVVGNGIILPLQPISAVVLRGNGDGTFRVTASILGNRVDAIAARDLTGDGIVDLALADQTSNTVRVLRGRADGGFSSHDTTTVSRMPIDVVTADLDGDGRYDGATANSQGTARNVSVLVNCTGEEGCASLPQPALRGDGNGDGEISAADLVAVARELLDVDGSEVEDVSRDGFRASFGADANGDGRVDAQDTTAAARRLFLQ